MAESTYFLRKHGNVFILFILINHEFGIMTYIVGVLIGVGPIGDNLVVMILARLVVFEM